MQKEFVNSSSNVPEELEHDISTWLLENKYQLLTRSPDGIHIIDRDGNLIYANRAFYQMLGYVPEEETPANVREWDVQWPMAEIPAIIEKLLQRSRIFTTRHKRKDGSTYEAQINVSMIEYRDQFYLYCSVRDITEQIRLANELEENREQYKFVVENIKEVVFRTDEQGHWLFLNPAWEEVTGFPLEESLGQVFLDYVHPDDRQRNTELFQPLIERKKDHCRHVIRYLHRDGGFRWIEVWARLTLDEHGNSTGTAGTLTDITERKNFEDALRENEAKYRSFVEQSTEGFFLTDESGRILEWNPAMEEITGLAREAVAGRPTWDIQMQILLSNKHVPEAYERIKASTQQFLITGDAPFLNKVIEPEFIRSTDDTPRFSRQWMFPIRTESGFRLGGTVRDITDRKMAEQALHEANMELRRQMAELRELKDKLQEQATRDPLTHLYNRRYLDETLPREVSRTLRLNQQLGFILLDVDHFKQINDTYGHRVGDESLLVMSRLLEAGFRSSDIVCRYGGDEVLCVLSDTNMEIVTRRAEQIRQEITEMKVMADSSEIHITVSIGIALLPGNGTEINTVLEAADKALYRAKETGRNRVCSA